MTGLIDDKIPHSVRKWTLQTVEYLVESYPKELNWIDYKEVLTSHPQAKNKDDHRDSIRRTVAGMANSCEGYLVFGVKDKGEGRDRIVGIDPKGDFTRDFGHIIAEITPRLSPFEEFQIRLTVPYDVTKVLWAVRILLSAGRPHMHKGQYPIRAVGGTCDYLKDHEVQLQLAAREDRRQKPRLLIQVLKSWLPIVITVSSELPYTPRRFQIPLLEKVLHDIAPYISDQLVQAGLDLAHVAAGINSAIDNIQRTYPKGPTTALGDPCNSAVGQERRNIEKFRVELCQLVEVLEKHFPSDAAGSP